MCDAPEADASIPDFWLGVFASLVGSVVLNFGINVQRLAHVRMAARPPDARRPYVKDPLWLAGFLVFAVGNSGDAIGLTFTPQSVITPIGSISLVSNLAFARWLNKEHVGYGTLASVALIIGGVLAIVLSADSSCSQADVEALIRNWSKPAMIAFAVVHLAVLACANAFVVGKERRMRAAGAGHVADGIGALTPRERRELRLAYALVASMYATWTVLLVKSVGELLKETFRGDNQFLRFEAYLLLLGAVVSAPLQVFYLNSGFALFESLFIVPAFYSFWCFGSILVGAFYWGEFDGFRPWQYGTFAVGVVANVAGVALLSFRAIDSRAQETSTAPAPGGVPYGEGDEPKAIAPLSAHLGEMAADAGWVTPTADRASHGGGRP
mmetsp:Transcript_23088/g.77485  ORF Transcript_23088/g.77485 Transcript_23088/m.77485 type:complete len:382 (-) Transcript_23088:665-1810(-)